MDTTIILGIAALAGIFAGAKALKKKNQPEKKKPSTAPTTAETPAKPAPLEDQAITTAETPAKPAPLEDQAVTTAETPPKPAPLEDQAVTTAETPAKPAPLEDQAVTTAETPPKPAALKETTESPPLPETFDDIIINHNCTSQEMVETLARNLDKIGYRVFSDNWETSSKQTDNSTANTLPNDSQAILVITPEAIESGWVREEYESMLKRQQNDPDFTFVPVVFNDALSDSPFLSDIELVNFSTEKYPEAFHRLVSFFGEKSFDDKDLELPPPFVAPTAALPRGTREFIQVRFNHFKQNSPPPLMLLAQSDRSQAPLIEALLTEAKTRYNRCLHIALPYSTAADTQDSFSVLAQQCEFSETVNNGVEFEQALLARLKNQSNQANPLFLLVSRFEHGAQSTRQQLAGIVRSLNESHANQVHIILCGGEKLVELKYLHGSHSLLNIAQEYHWPELERADVYAMRDNCCQDLVLDDEDTDKLLIESGRHPTLLQKCLQLYQNDPTRPWQDYQATLSLEPLAWRLFTPFTRSQKEIQQMRAWLAHEEVAPASALYSYGDKRNELLQRLYWKNLLIERPIKGRKQLCWRSEALRSAGHSVISYQLSVIS